MEQEFPLKSLLVLAGISALIYVLNRFLIVPSLLEPGLFSNYVGDFLALPVYLPLSLLLSVKLGIVHQNYTFNFYHILGAVLVFSVLFEGLIPVVHDTAISDPWDIMAYLMGGIVVYIVSRCSVQNSV